MKRTSSDESYILDLIEHLLDEKCRRQARFDGLLGDEGRNKRRLRLPVDGYFPEHNLIVEYMEKQHSEPVAVMDNRMTISGCPRGRQRQLYQERKRRYAADNGYLYLEVDYRSFEHFANGRLRRNHECDTMLLRTVLMALIVKCTSR